MEDNTTIGAVLSALVVIGGIVFGAVARVRSFEQSIIAEVDKRIDEAFKSMEDKLNTKADAVSAVRVEQTVNSLNAAITDFMRRQDEHIKVLYDQDHAQDAQINNLRVEVASKCNG
jgi:hypothetical protein